MLLLSPRRPFHKLIGPIALSLSSCQSTTIKIGIKDWVVLVYVSLIFPEHKEHDSCRIVDKCK